MLKKRKRKKTVAVFENFTQKYCAIQRMDFRGTGKPDVECKKLIITVIIIKGSQRIKKVEISVLTYNDTVIWFFVVQ